MTAAGTTATHGSIAKRVAVATAATTLAIVLGLGTLSYWNTRQLIDEQIIARLETETAEITDHVEDLLNEVAGSATSLSSNMMVVNALIDSAGRDTYILPFLRSHSLAQRGVGITLYDFRGIAIASSLQDSQPSYRKNRRLLSRVVEKGRTAASLKTEQENLYLFLAMPLVYPATGLPEGMLVMTADISGRMREIVHAASADQDLTIRLLERGLPVWRHEHAGGEASFAIKRSLKLAPPLDKLALSIVIGQVGDDAFLPLRRMTAAYLIAGFFIVALTVALAVIHGRRIGRPLEQLSAAARTVAETGLPATRLDAKGPGEIASLSASINTMLSRLQESAEHLEQRVRERTQELASVNDSLRSREMFISSILNTVDEGFIVVDRNYRILTANQAYCRQVGRELPEVLGKSCYVLSHHLDRPCFEEGGDCAVKEVFESGAPAKTVHVHEGPGETVRHVESKAFPLRDENGNIHTAIEVIADITGRIHLEDQLRQAQKMEAVGLLAGGIAHDFNNILTAIVGYGNILKLKIPKDGPLTGHVNNILQSAERATSLTQGLLAFSRKQLIQPAAMDLNEIVNGFESFLRRLLGEDIELRIQTSDEPLVIMADRAQVEQIIMNISANANDAMPKGGVLTIGISRQAMDADFIRRHGFGRPGEYACLAISDTGEGMDERTRQRIYEPFFTTKQLGRGTGLGLSIVYGAVQQNQGFIEVESEPGRGTRFLLYFPLLTSAAARPAETETDAARGGSETILVAEDEKILRDLAATVLREFGYEVIEAADGVEAVQKFSAAQNSIRLALLDVVMPRKNGKDAGDEIRRIRPDIKLLFMSGYSADVVSGKGIVGPGDEVLTKPFAPAILLSRIRALLDSG